MGTVLYLECASGASGDMLLGALLDLGVSLDDVRAALGELLPAGAELRAERVMRSGISATAFRVVEAPDAVRAPGAARPHRHRHLHQILALIDRAAFGPATRERARSLYERLARAEADIHRVPLERVHLHEVGALDSIVDIVGTVWAIDALGVDRIVASPLNVGGGRVQTEHGLLPVPAPATLRLLAGAPVYSDGTDMELVTPTGALLVTGHAAAYGPLPAMVVERTGYGAGGKDLPGRPNVLRAVLGRESAGEQGDQVAVLECNIDDMNPQLFGPVMDRLYAAGALEVFYVAVQMKKNRPGTLVTVIAPPARQDELLTVLFRETTTIGVRYARTARECLEREVMTVLTPWGPARVKVSRRGRRVMTATPEFEDCARLAGEQRVPVKDVMAAVQRAYLDSPSGRAGGPAATGGVHE